MRPDADPHSDRPSARRCRGRRRSPLAAQYALVPFVVLGVGCSAAGTAPPLAPAARVRRAPPSLRPPSTLAGDFAWRQRVTVEYGDRAARSFDCVLQKRGDRLLLVGLTPLNTVTFTVEQRGLEVTFDNRTGESLPFDGRYILQDVQRVFFPWLEGPTEGGRRTGVVLGETVTERLEGGQVVSRVFERDGRPPVRVRLGGRGHDEPPARAVLHNERFGYRLIIETAPADSP